MTHDELLLQFSTCDCKDCKALLAVVKLHEPAIAGQCLHCMYTANSEMESWIEYPCPTIQAIEKELE